MTYHELFPNRVIDSSTVEARILVALCFMVDAIKEQTAEFHAMRIALCGGDQKTFSLDAPGRVEYPWCATCNCYHHPENDHCILRGGMGVNEALAMAQQQAPGPQQSSEQNAAEAAQALATAMKLEAQS